MIIYRRKITVVWPNIAFSKGEKIGTSYMPLLCDAAEMFGKWFPRIIDAGRLVFKEKARAQQ